MKHPDWTHSLLSDDDLDALERAIDAAEARTSGEICVHLERRVTPGREPDDADVLARAREVFEHLGMARTAGRNAVLIYLAVDDHRLAVIGDVAIHARVGDAYWARVRDIMVEELRAGRPREALLRAIAEVGDTLARHFPPGADDVDELPNRPRQGDPRGR